ncbi:MAG: efflux RND transporter permease subunit [Anaerolineae bacterium]|nr:efflux RND transporter permease subunit [Anaerolineae bacterium]
MGLTRLSIYRPLTMLMIILALVVMGYRAFTFLQLDSFPKVDFPFVTVVTIFPGASPEDVEDLVVKPIEDAVAGIAGIDQLTSRSTEGLGTVTIAFVEGTDGNQAAIDVERQVATVRGQLPTEAEDPTIIKADINAIPIMVATLSGPQSQDTLFEIADETLKSRLQAISGVASVSVSGGREREIQVQADPAKMAAYGLPFSAIQQAVSANNVTFPAGSLDEGRLKTSIRSVGEFTTVEEIESVVVKNETDKGGGLVYLRDVATVSEGLKDQEQILRNNGLDAVSINVTKTSDSNTVEVANGVRQAIEEFQKDLPAGAELSIVLDGSEFIRESVAAVQEDLVLAILITGLVMLVFLHTIRSTFIVLLAIPTCIMVTFLVMWILGFSLNQLTLLALTLVIGILVDDSIVVIENIERHLKMKKPPTQAALEGRSEIGLAAITITLVDVVVYLPVAFTSGIIGQFFFSYGVTIAVATLASLFVAFTLTPMLAAFWMKDESQPEEAPRGLGKFFGILFKPITWLWNGFIRLWEAGFDALASFYGLTLRFFLANFFTQTLAVIIAVAALAGGVYLVIGGFVGSEFFPQQDDGQIQISVRMPPGTNLEATDRAARQVERIVLNEVPEVATILTRVGSRGGGGGFGGDSGSGSSTATIDLRLVDKADRQRSTTDIANLLRPLLAKIPEASTSVVLQAGAGGGGGGSPIQVRISGPDQSVLIDLANQIEAVAQTVPGAVEVRNTDAARAVEAQLIVNRDRALDLGLSPAQVATTLRTAVSGNTVGQFNPSDANEIDITLRVAETSRQDLSQLLQLPLGYRDSQPITLEQVAEVQREQAPALITRADRQRVLSVGSNISGRTIGEVTDDMEEAINAQVSFPPGYGFEFIGQSEQQRESFAQLGQALLLAVVLIYMLLVALFQSWLHPLAIMFSLPVTLVGAFGGLWLTGNTLNIISILGIILLTGVVTKNAILLVDFTNVLREERGYTRKAALIEAGKLRLRPIIMTTAAIVFALLPLLLGTGAGAEGRAPLAAVVIGGNISSTALTLILVPVVYSFLDGAGGLTTRLFRKIFGLRERSRGLQETEKVPEREAPPASRRPAPQSGSAISLKPETGSDTA